MKEDLTTYLYHRLHFDLPLTQSSIGSKECYRCQDCGLWTDDAVFWSARVCLKRDRRRGSRRRILDRRSRSAEKENEEVLIQALALLEVFQCV